MTKINSLNKALLVLALANSAAILSVSAKKAAKPVEAPAPVAAAKPTMNKPAEIVAPVQAIPLDEAITRASFPTVNTPKLLVNKKAVTVGILLANEINPWKTKIPTGTSKDLNIDNYIPDETGTTVFSGNVKIKGGLTIDSSANTTCLDSDIAIKAPHKLLVNEINPVKTASCVADDSKCAFTHFSGGIKIKDGRHFGQIEDVTLDQANVSVGILRLRFSPLDQYDCTTPYPAAVRVHYTACANDDYDHCYSVLVTQEFAIFPVSPVFCQWTSGPTVCSSQSTGTFLFDAFSEIEQYDGFVDVYVTLEVSNTNDTPYTGCLSYEIVGCHNLLEVECLPTLPNN